MDLLCRQIRSVFGHSGGNIGAVGPAFSLLGPLEVRSTSGALVHLGGQKPRGLLAMLLVHRGRPVQAERLVHALWGESPSAGAAATLRSHVVRVRRLLDEAGTPARIESRSGAYVLMVDPEDVDADRFERLLAEGRAAAASGQLVDAGDLLDEALGLWRGDVLADLGAPEYAVAPAADLAEKRLLAHEARLDVQLALGRHVDAVPVLQTLVEEHPFRERFAAQLMLALYRSGRQADALTVAASTRARLADELGLDPGAELQDLETAVLRQSPALELAEPVPAVAEPATASWPPLLERHHERKVLVGAVAAAASGRGQVVAVAGDAGTGKTALVKAATIDGPPVRVLRGQCDPLTTPRPYGPLRDIAAAAGVTVWDRGAEVVLAEICDEVVSALVSEPTVLVVEDLHWVDAATVEVLRFLARRSASLQLSLIVTYRDHEIGPQHPARPLLGDLARLENGAALRLGALSVDGIATLLGPDCCLEPARVHELTGGNPFFVVEVCSDPDRPLPSSIRDSLLDRTSGLSPDDLRLLQLAALSPERLDDALLRELQVDLPALTRLESTGLLDADGAGLSYRHELARQAVASTIPTAGEPHLHALMLDALERSGHGEPALLTHHAVGAIDRERAFTHACAAAEDAARSGAHGEAVAFFEIALRHQSRDDPAARAELLFRLAFEQYLTSHLTEATETVGATFELWQRAEDGAGLAAAYDRFSVFRYYAGDRREAETYADRAAHLAAEAGLAVPHGAARATRGFLNYLRGELDLARSCAFEAAAAAEDADERMLGVRADLISALAELAADDEAARPRVMDVIAEARAGGWDELASTGWSQLSVLDVEHGRLGLAAAVLDESIPFTVRRDIPICRHWQTAVRSRIHLGHGQWDSALLDADDVIRTDGMEVARLWPYLISGLVPMRRGDDADVDAPLDRAWSLAESIDEPIRRLSALAVLAEVMWTRDVPDQRVVEHASVDLARLGGAPGAHWAAGELAVWLRRLSLLRDVPANLAVPHEASLTGRHRDAATWWQDHAHTFQAALCLTDSDDPDDVREGLAALESLGATGTLARLAASLPTAEIVGSES